MLLHPTQEAVLRDDTKNDCEEAYIGHGCSVLHQVMWNFFTVHGMEKSI